MIIKDWSVLFGDKKIIFTINDMAKHTDEFNNWSLLHNAGKQLDLTVTPVTKKRSLSQNSYMWLLCTEIANVLRQDKQAVYIHMLSTYGQREPVVFAVIDKAFDTLVRSTDGYAIKVGERVHQDKVYYDVAILRGSSTYNSREMSILIDGVMSECKDLSIATKSQDEVRLMSLF